MNNNSVYQFPERVKNIYKKHFPEETDLTYTNLPFRIDEKLDGLFVEETDIIPGSGPNELSEL